MMAQTFTKQTLKVVVAQICQTIGWHAIQSTPLEILVDVLNRYLEEVAKTTHMYTDQFGRTKPNLDDLGLAFSEMGIDLKELEEYIQFVDPVPCQLNVPKYPVPKQSHLNFLKPGSQEVVTRPVHVHEHLPPTLIHAEEEESGCVANVDSCGSPQTSPQGVFKRPGDPIDSPAVKRARIVLEEEGRPLREISSVMMTTGGLLSPAREGKLPEPKVTLPIDRSDSPQPTSYPSVPPEVNREKKKKKVAPSGESVSVKPEKEKRKEERRRGRGGDEGIKKLASMKELAKLKALKPGAMKMSPHYPRPGSNKIQSVSDAGGEKSLIQKLSEAPHLVVTPVKQIAKRPASPPVTKLSTEPDKQKLNIFKKISKVKEEKPHDDGGAGVQVTSRERSPGMVIEEVKRPCDGVSSPPIQRPRTPDIPSIYDNDLSYPDSPTMPKTPDILRPSLEHRKKKKDKEKKKRNKPKEKKHVVSEEERSERPKTPELTNTPVFPFYSHYPPAPGLIPPPISSTLFPRYPLPPGASFPHPAMPNLPLPPPLFMQHTKEQDVKKEKQSRVVSPILGLVKEKDATSKSPLSLLISRDKASEKKKEHKKEKKEKLKKKKEKKEKSKSKEKGEKKRKEEKHHKSKEKKEKKKKEKLLMVEESGVPKLTLKISPSSPSTQSPPEFKRETSPQVARISSLFNKQTKEVKTTPVTKQLHVQTTEAIGSPVLKSPGTIIDKDGNKVWICPACGRPDDGTPMIGCDVCDAWYHWVCVNIQVPPDENEDWYCRFCIVKKQGSHHSEPKKRGRKKKPPV